MNRVQPDSKQPLNKLQLKHLPQVNKDEYSFECQNKYGTQIITTHVKGLVSQEKRK